MEDEQEKAVLEIDRTLVLTIQTVSGELLVSVDSNQIVDIKLRSLQEGGFIDDEEVSRIRQQYSDVMADRERELQAEVDRLEEERRLEAERLEEEQRLQAEAQDAGGGEEVDDSEESEGLHAVPDPPAPPDPVEFTVSTEELIRELSLADKVAEKKNSIPVLKKVLLSVTRGSVTVQSTDLDHTLVSTLRTANVVREGALVMFYGPLLNLARKLPKGSVISFYQSQKEATAGAVHISSGKFTSTLFSESIQHFPSHGTVNELPYWIQAHALNLLINRVIFAITTEESRYALNGAMLCSKEGAIRMVTSDGHRLALAETMQGHIDAPKGILIQKKALKILEVLTSLKEFTEADYIPLGFSEDYVAFSLGDRILYSRLLAGQFPNYELILPKECEKMVRFSPADLQAAIGRLEAVGVVDDRSHGIELYIGEDELRVGAQAIDIGTGVDSISAITNCAGFHSGFNSRYILDFFKQLDKKDSCILKAKDDQSPIVLYASETGSAVARIGRASLYDVRKGYLYVVMPMRLSNDNKIAEPIEEKIARLFLKYVESQDLIDAYLEAEKQDATMEGIELVDVLYALEERGFGDQIEATRAERAWKAEIVPVFGADEVSASEAIDKLNESHAVEIAS